MVNDITTLNGSLSQLGETLATNITTKGVSADADEGLTTLAGKILSIPSGSGASNVVQGTFTTGSSGNTNGTVNIDYNGTGYPIACIVYVDGGMYNNGTGGNTTWYNSVNRYDVGLFLMSKARVTTAPTYTTSGADNYGIVTYWYKSSTSSSTSYSRNGSVSANTFTSSSTSGASGNNIIRFKGNSKTMSYYIGNRTSSTYGLARDTKFAYIIIYSQ